MSQEDVWRKTVPGSGRARAKALKWARHVQGTTRSQGWPEGLSGGKVRGRRIGEPTRPGDMGLDRLFCN